MPMNYRADVHRMSNVHLRAMDPDGNIIEEDLEEFPAIITQHEIRPPGRHTVYRQDQQIAPHTVRQQGENGSNGKSAG